MTKKIVLIAILKYNVVIEEKKVYRRSQFNNPTAIATTATHCQVQPALYKLLTLD